jgi:hypothetical protein
VHSPCHRESGISAFVHNRFRSGWFQNPCGGTDGWLPVSLPLLPQSGHLDDEQRHSGDVRRRRPQRVAKVQARVNDVGRVHLVRWGTLNAGSIRGRPPAISTKHGYSHPLWTPMVVFGNRLTDDERQSVNLVLLDIKCWDAERHRRLTRINVNRTLDFACRLASSRRSVWLRPVLVPGLTDHPEDVAQMAQFAATLGNIERVDVLPFHQLGRFKWNNVQLELRP